jgi:hypothetical protein
MIHLEAGANIGISDIAIFPEVTLGEVLQTNSEPGGVVLIADSVGQRVAVEAGQEEVQSYTDVQLAGEIGFNPGRIKLIRCFLGIEVEAYAQQDASKIKKHIDGCYAVQNARPNRSPEAFLPKNISKHTAIGKEIGITGEEVRQLVKKIRSEKGPLSWEETEREIRQYKKTNNNPLTSESIVKRNKQTRSEKTAIIESVKPQEKAKIVFETSPGEAIRIRPDYPNVLTPEYLDPLTSAEKIAVKMLASSSISHQVVIRGDAQKAIEYLIKEKIYPRGARIRMRINRNECSYYLEYCR